ncbi:WhiB family transcriptional regulator [Pseudonocardia sp. CA-142604]|uniref:WhiB family transcriptional regulator n=1 Tax=Pseudonocardia sp. CA-142604 TaxID=3240024 RepID=UPI003D915FE3
MNTSRSHEQMSAELDGLAEVPSDVLASWVSDRGRCQWEATFDERPEWTGEGDADRGLAAQICAGCLARAECLELELRIGGAQTVGVWGALNEEDRRALHEVWSCRRRTGRDLMPSGEWS